MQSAYIHFQETGFEMLKHKTLDVEVGEEGEELRQQASQFAQPHSAIEGHIYEAHQKDDRSIFHQGKWKRHIARLTAIQEHAQPKLTSINFRIA